MPHVETNKNTYSKLIKKLANAQKPEALRGLLADLGASEIASSLLQLKLKHQVTVFEQLSHDLASEVLTYLHQHTPVLENLIEQMPLKRLGILIEDMDRDDAADVVSAMDDKKASEVLDILPEEERQEITSLLQYDEESAGGIMDPHVIAVRLGVTVEQAIQVIRVYCEEKDLERFYAIYVVDEFHHLVGRVRLAQLFLADLKRPIKDLMEAKVISVNVNQDQEDVVRLAQEYNLTTVPVVDKYSRLIGRITSDDLMDVLHEEYEEDIGQFAGTGDEEVLEPSVFSASRDRLPWLLLGLGGGLLAAMVMSRYEHSLASLPQAAYFIPLIAALGGNIAIQSSSLVVRGLTTGELSHFDIIKRTWKELRVGFLNGIICATILTFSAWGLTGEVRMGVSTGFALLVVICLAALLGTIAPMGLKRFRLDPALATGPFITTANDLLGIMVYLAITFGVYNQALIK
ncbi:magnesium transporter [Deltaproteobacteria bacterium TL4]